MAKKKGWLTLGVLIRNSTTREGTPIPANEQKTYLQLSDEVREVLSKAGYNVGKNGILVTPTDKVERLIKNGAIPENEVEEQRTAAKERSTWLKYEIQIPPPKED